MKPEQIQRNKIVTYINSLPQCKAIIVHSPIIRGYPDVFASIFGVCTVIEVKLDGHYRNRKGQALQRRELETWHESLADAFYLEMPSEWGAFRSFLGNRAKEYNEKMGKLQRDATKKNLKVLDNSTNAT